MPTPLDARAQVAFYDAHTSGELSSRLINDSGQLQTLVQFVSQNALQASVVVNFDPHTATYRPQP